MVLKLSVATLIFAKKVAPLFINGAILLEMSPEFIQYALGTGYSTPSGIWSE